MGWAGLLQSWGRRARVSCDCACTRSFSLPLIHSATRSLPHSFIHPVTPSLTTTSTCLAPGGVPGSMLGAQPGPPGVAGRPPLCLASARCAVGDQGQCLGEACVLQAGGAPGCWTQNLWISGAGA